MDIDIAIELGTNLKTKLNIDGTIVIAPKPSNGFIYPADGGTAFFSNGVGMNRLLSSDGEMIGDSTLKSLVFRLVYESKDMSREERAMHLTVELGKMLPNYHIVVYVFDRNTKRGLISIGPNKGAVYIDDSNLGEPVHILLT